MFCLSQRTAAQRGLALFALQPYTALSLGQDAQRVRLRVEHPLVQRDQRLRVVRRVLEEEEEDEQDQ